MVQKKCQQKQKSTASKRPPASYCLIKQDPQQLFIQNTKDMAYVITHIMNICGISERKTKTARESILYAFKHYDEVHYRIDEMPKRIIRKEHLLFDLTSNCEMTPMEARLTYAIVKRAFKAFYYCTDEFGIRDLQLEAKMTHNQQCLWMHAAKRTAEIYAQYCGIFHRVQKKIEEHINCIYKEFYECMQKRACLLALSKCGCRNCVKINACIGRLNKSEYNTNNDNLVVDMPTETSSSSVDNIRNSKSERPPLTNSRNCVEPKQSPKNLTICKKCKCVKLPPVREKSNNKESNVNQTVWLTVTYSSDSTESKQTERQNPNSVCDDPSKNGSHDISVCVCGESGSSGANCMSDASDASCRSDASNGISKKAAMSAPKRPSSLSDPLNTDYTPTMLKDRKICNRFSSDKSKETASRNSSRLPSVLRDASSSNIKIEQQFLSHSRSAILTKEPSSRKTLSRHSNTVRDSKNSTGKRNSSFESFRYKTPSNKFSSSLDIASINSLNFNDKLERIPPGLPKKPSKTNRISQTPSEKNTEVRQLAGRGEVHNSKTPCSRKRGEGDTHQKIPGTIPKTHGVPKRMGEGDTPSRDNAKIMPLQRSSGGNKSEQYSISSKKSKISVRQTPRKPQRTHQMCNKCNKQVSCSKQSNACYCKLKLTKSTNTPWDGMFKRELLLMRSRC